MVNLAFSRQHTSDTAAQQVPTQQVPTQRTYRGSPSQLHRMSEETWLVGTGGQRVGVVGYYPPWEVAGQELWIYSLAAPLTYQCLDCRQQRNDVLIATCGPVVLESEPEAICPGCYARRMHQTTRSSSRS